MLSQAFPERGGGRVNSVPEFGGNHNQEFSDAPTENKPRRDFNDIAVEGKSPAR